jgi:hypothetical protein
MLVRPDSAPSHPRSWALVWQGSFDRRLTGYAVLATSRTSALRALAIRWSVLAVGLVAPRSTG